MVALPIAPVAVDGYLVEEQLPGRIPEIFKTPVSTLYIVCYLCAVKPIFARDPVPFPGGWIQDLKPEQCAVDQLFHGSIG
jgi:hypothetical protein